MLKPCAFHSFVKVVHVYLKSFVSAELRTCRQREPLIFLLRLIINSQRLQVEVMFGLACVRLRTNISIQLIHLGRLLLIELARPLRSQFILSFLRKHSHSPLILESFLLGPTMINLRLLSVSEVAADLPALYVEVLLYDCEVVALLCIYLLHFLHDAEALLHAVFLGQMLSLKQKLLNCHFHRFSYLLAHQFLQLLFIQLFL